MTEASEQDLIRRVERLERERRWTWRAGIVMAGVLALASLGWASDHTNGPGELKAQAFVLIDETATRAASSASCPAARAYRALLPSSCGERRGTLPRNSTRSPRSISSARTSGAA